MMLPELLALPTKASFLMNETLTIVNVFNCYAISCFSYATCLTVLYPIRCINASLPPVNDFRI